MLGHGNFALRHALGDALNAVEGVALHQVGRRERTRQQAFQFSGAGVSGIAAAAAVA